MSKSSLFAHLLPEPFDSMSELQLRTFVQKAEERAADIMCPKRDERLWRTSEMFFAACMARLRWHAIMGRTGWDDPDLGVAEIKRRIEKNLKEGDMLDVANLAFLAWLRRVGAVKPR